MALTRGKKIVFALIAMGLSAVVSVGGLLAFDIYLHNKFAKDAGLNVWGYRGPVVGRKEPGEKRVVVLGGSTAFGFGVTHDKSIPAYVERKLNERRRQSGAGSVSVVNLGYNNEGAYSFLYTLRDYTYLDYDVVVLYTGYNDIGGPNHQVFRHTSPVFRLTGYLPIFPLIFQEKAMVLRFGGHLDAAYRGERTLFTPTFKDRTTASALEAAAQVARSLERQLGRLTDPDTAEARATGVRCDGEWSGYCQYVAAAVDYALGRGKRVLVVGQPYVSDAHVSQQRILEGMLHERFGDDARVRVINLGRSLDLTDPTFAWDSLHLTAAGNARIAEQLVQPTLDILQ